MSDSPKAVSLVIPGRDCVETLRPCLNAVLPLLDGPHLQEIIFVDDGSVDGSGDLARELGVRVLMGPGKGAGFARNLGWRQCQSPLVWFVDSDCVSEPDALDLLMPLMATDEVAAVGGSYGNMRPDRILSCLIHEEIIARHLKMSKEVNFLATFNVLYRRDVLEQVGGFDPRFVKAQDAELAFRVGAEGHTLCFERRSQVKHFHLADMLRYFKVQRQQGYWRAWLYRAHPDHSSGDSYSNVLDHLQPPLGLAVTLGLIFPLFGPVGWGLETVLVTALLACQAPMTFRLIRRTGQLRYLAFAPMSAIRSAYRGVGFVHGIAAIVARRWFKPEQAEL
ncbi:MAG TPA: hypothetical protein DCQ06_03420 [Myxococcales bacterium]|nr:hypothetical protein [Myxococcales bacterium]HAN30626.1 hypothetical protein [Myxococcales bacterium]